MASEFLVGEMVCQWKDRLSVGSAPGETFPCALWGEPDAVALFIALLPRMSLSVFNHMG